jgi:biotin carboxyl carrier protein
VGDDLLVIEAMKMRNSIKAKRSGYVQEVMVQPGQLVTTGMPLMKLW